jgi:hypothetical protein
MNKREREIEHYARERIEACGGWMLKWTSPGRKGVPDDIVFWPHIRPHFVEFKRVDQDGARTELSESQQYVNIRLNGYGQHVHVFYTEGDVENYISSIGR